MQFTSILKAMNEHIKNPADCSTHFIFWIACPQGSLKYNMFCKAEYKVQKALSLWQNIAEHKDKYREISASTLNFQKVVIKFS